MHKARRSGLAERGGDGHVAGMRKLRGMQTGFDFTKEPLWVRVIVRILNAVSFYGLAALFILSVTKFVLAALAH